MTANAALAAICVNACLETCVEAKVVGCDNHVVKSNIPVIWEYFLTVPQTVSSIATVGFVPDQ